MPTAGSGLRDHTGTAMPPDSMERLPVEGEQIRADGRQPDWHNSLCLSSPQLTIPPLEADPGWCRGVAVPSPPHDGSERELHELVRLAGVLPPETCPQ